MPYRTRAGLVVLLFIFVITIITIAGVSFVAVNTPNSTNTITVIIGFSGTLIASLFTLLKTEKNYDTIKETKSIVQDAAPKLDYAQTQITEIKDKLNEAPDVDEVVEKTVRRLLGESGYRELIRQTVEEFCNQAGFDRKLSQVEGRVDILRRSLLNTSKFLGLETEVQRLQGAIEDE